MIVYSWGRFNATKYKKPPFYISCVKCFVVIFSFHLIPSKKKCYRQLILFNKYSIVVHWPKNEANKYQKYSTKIMSLTETRWNSTTLFWNASIFFYIPVDICMQSVGLHFPFRTMEMQFRNRNILLFYKYT